jgi:hypothetical protein
MLQEKSAESILMQKNICWSKLDGKEVKVGPDLAERILQFNKNNRPLSNAIVGKYAKAMADGQWVRSQLQTIGIHLASNTLLDGQHRLKAIIQSGVSVWLRIVLVKGDAQKISETIDTCRRRSASDTLAMAGYTRTNRLSAAALLLIRYRSPTIHTAKGVATNTDIRTAVEHHPKLVESTESIAEISALKEILSPSVAVFSHYLFGLADKDYRDLFFDALASGAGLEESSPVLKLRNLALRQRANSEKQRNALPQEWILAITIKAWNAFVTGKEIRVLKWSIDESFPRAIDCDGKQVVIK